jgi:hypothetical protein
MYRLLPLLADRVAHRTDMRELERNWLTLKLPESKIGYKFLISRDIQVRAKFQ